jgi:hypothetical protein
MGKWGTRFSDDLGDLFENYIGAQLRLQSHGPVEFGFKYDHDRKEAFDYIITLPEVVVLFEVKSVRPTAAVRAGSDAARSEIERMLAKGIAQLERADELIERGHSAFVHIPTDRPRVGALITMEDFHVVNSTSHAPVSRRDRPALPITIASAGQIEYWVTVEDATPGRVILDALARSQNRDDPTPGFALRRALEGRKHRGNTIIEADWEMGPWQQLTEG